MSKSTPLNQIPYSPGGSPTVASPPSPSAVNAPPPPPQHHHMHSPPLPPPPAAAQPLPDDDATIQEVMQQFNASTTTHAQPDGPVAMYDAASLQPPPHAFPATYVPAGGAASGGEWAAAPLASEQAPSTLMDDARLALLVTLSVVVVHLLPLDTLLQGRLPAQLEAFPYTMLLVRALSAGVLVVLGRRFLLGSI